MRINGHGKARLLKPHEIEKLFSEGFKCARDRAIFGLCLYTACRISEARQIYYADIFVKGVPHNIITFRKGTTKRKLETRQIFVHPNLAKLLKQYHDESEKLLKLKEVYGGWSSNTACGKERPICPKCGSFRTNKDGSKGGVQRYKCLKCNWHFKQLIGLEEQSSISTNKNSFKDKSLLSSISSEAKELRSPDLEYSNQQVIVTSDSNLIEAPSFTYPVLEKILVPNFDELGVGYSGSYGLLFANPENPYLFPGQEGKNCITATVMNDAFNEACERVGIKGAGTHSLRRTTLTTLHKQNEPLKVIQKISGHQRLKNLQKYLEVDENDVGAAIDSLD